MEASSDGVPSFTPITVDTFVMGAPDSEDIWDSWEKEAQHKVTLTYTFVMAVHETTQAEFEALMCYNPSYFTGCGANCPVDAVSWHEALAYANALSLLDGYSECFDCAGTQRNFTCSLKAEYAKPQDCLGYRLPTEAEWEYACRAGTTTPFNTGNKLTATQANYYLEGDYRQQTLPVGSYNANAFGLYDMHGNVWEWCNDFFDSDYYANSPQANPKGTATGSERVNRGGGWYADPQYCRVADRSVSPSSRHEDFLGFRIVLSAK